MVVPGGSLPTLVACFLGGAALQQGAWLISSSGSTREPAIQTTATPVESVSTASGWTVSVETALQLLCCALALGFLVGVYACYRLRSLLAKVVSEPTVSVVNQTRICVPSAALAFKGPTTSNEGIERGTRRGRRGVSEKSGSGKPTYFTLLDLT